MKNFNLFVFFAFFLCKLTYAQVHYYPYDSLSKISDKRGHSDIAIDDTGRVWVGFNGIKTQTSFVPSSLGLQTIGADSVWRQVNTSAEGGPSTKQISSLAFKEGALWVATAQGLYRKNANTWQRYASDTNRLDSINQMIFKEKNIFLATQNGIKCFYRIGFINYWVHYHTGNSALPTNKINGLDRDAQGNFWLATDMGIIFFEPNKNAFSKFDNIQSEFPNNYILSVKVLENGEVWAGTESYKGIGIDPISGHQEKVPGLFLLKNNRFVNVLSNFGFCTFNLYPQTGFLRLSTIDSKICFIATVKKGPYTYWAWFQINSKGISYRFIQPLAALPNQVPLQYPYVFHKNHIYNYLQYPGRLCKIYLPGIPRDTSYEWNLSEMQRSTNYHYREVFDRIQINQISAPISVRGDMFLVSLEGNNGLRLKNRNCKPISYAGALWMGGTSNGDLHLAAGTYRQSGLDYAQGPLPAIPNKAADTTVRLQFGRIWNITETQIREYKKHRGQSSYIIPEPILSWPAHGDSSKGYSAQIAPFEDQNANGKYEPLLGDYPTIKGQQDLFWIFNDSLVIHSETESKPLGVEVQANTYAYVCDQISDNHPNRALNHTIFIKYKIINRSNRTYENFNAGFWLSSSLGSYLNDGVGSNPKHNYAYIYNLDTLEAGFDGYEEPYPAMALVMLKGFIDETGKESLAARAVSYTNDFSVRGYPSRPEHNYSYLQGRWKDNTPITYGGIGYGGKDSNQVWMFPGEDDGLGRPWWADSQYVNYPIDRALLLPTQNITLSPGEVQEIVYAMVVCPSTSKDLKLLTKDLHKDVLMVKEWYSKDSFPSCSNYPLYIEEQTDSIDKQALKIYPNPAGELMFIQAQEPIKYLEIYDLMGKLVSSYKGFNIESIGLTQLPFGLYILRAQTLQGSYSAKFLKE